ncbi:MAG: glucose-6-phosphate isomerase [Gammaproteobacteria bacterium]|nr:glucose-6-phosphate isomerase [Gammaproteobacteria bacterium]
MSEILSTLRPHAERLLGLRTLSLFDADVARTDDFGIEAAGLYLDYSKQRLDRAALAALLELATKAALTARIEGLFRGDIVNPTEARPALHTALRNPEDLSATVNGEPVGPLVAHTLARMHEVVKAISKGQWRGASGDTITDVVNLGIGGSHLGPQLVCDALRNLHTEQPRVHFVSNVDGGDIDRCLSKLNPARTLFIVASKSFTTPETAVNARTAQAWVTGTMTQADAIARHFFAITANPARAVAFGIAPDNVLPMWDWVGGRYSLWSAIGLPIALAVGSEAFTGLLEGAREMDEHFRRSPLASNLPVLLALIGLWNTNALEAESYALVPYDERLMLFPAWLQQLEMESNGKRITLGNEPVGSHTSPVVWGGVGTNVQHAFFQLLHQGTRRIPVDFILPLTHSRSPQAHHDMLVANCFAQAEALMVGRSREVLLAENPDPVLALHREQPGNQPSNVLLMEALTPRSLGALLALYEHRTFVQGVMWNINSFDQWGVELGKKLAATLLEEIHEGHVGSAHDGSTRSLLQRYLKARQT